MNFDIKYATPNFDAKYKKCKIIRNIAIACIPLGFLMFGGGVPLAIISDRLYLLFIPILGFFMIPASFCTMGFMITKAANMRQTQSAIDIIKSQDKTYFFQLASGAPALELQVSAFVNKLIENGLLEGYSVIGGVAVVKTSAGYTEKSIMRDYALLRFGKMDDDKEDATYPAGSLSDYAEKKYGDGDSDADTKECYFCHTRVPSDALYCTKCGARLDN